MPNEIQVKTVLNKTKRRDPWFLDDYTANPYSGCSFNCLYCYIRGSKYGTHMEEKLGIKVNSPEILEKNLAARAKKGQYGIVVMASATDPYLHFEQDYQLTRRFLELFLKYRFPVHIITKSDLVIRDFDLLKEIDANAVLPAELEGKLSRKVFVTFSFSTLDDRVGAIFEPGATPPSARLQTLKTTLAAGFHSGVSLMPLLPWISDKGDILEETYRTFSNYRFRLDPPCRLGSSICRGGGNCLHLSCARWRRFPFRLEPGVAHCVKRRTGPVRRRRSCAILLNRTGSGLGTWPESALH